MTNDLSATPTYARAPQGRGSEHHPQRRSREPLEAGGLDELGVDCIIQEGINDSPQGEEGKRLAREQAEACKKHMESQGYKCSAFFGGDGLHPSPVDAALVAKAIFTATTKAIEELLDERELDKEIQRRPYTNDGENHD